MDSDQTALYFIIRKKKTKKKKRKVHFENGSLTIVRGLQIGSFFEIGSESGGDRRVIHNVVKWRGASGQHTELLRLFLCEATGGEPRSQRFRLGIRLRSALLFVLARIRFNVVGLGRPAEERWPPVRGRGGFSAIGVWLRRKRNGTGLDPGGSECN